MSGVLEIKNLRKSYGAKEVISGLHFQVEKGDILGLIGPNGAGKSTTIRIVTDVEQSSEGSIYYDGKETRLDITNFKKRLGVVPQEIAVYDDLSAYDNVRFFCSIYGYSGKELKRRAEEALRFVGLWDRRKERPTKYSGGMKRRLNIACSIAHSPELLIMDEPTVGIDPQSRNHIMETIKTLNARGTTVIYVSHYMEEIEEICNRVVIVDHGSVIEDQGKEELKVKYKEHGLMNLEEIFLHLTGTQLRDEQA
ncbi:MAG TPA: ABC transporter ATP-binding protein [Lachnospiraceae bacterium]|nr:ABC transporter ATP-binding protein [Lachnospiraceae bacterium]